MRPNPAAASRESAPPRRCGRLPPPHRVASPLLRHWCGLPVPGGHFLGCSGSRPTAADTLAEYKHRMPAGTIYLHSASEHSPAHLQRGFRVRIVHFQPTTVVLPTPVGMLPFSPISRLSHIFPEPRQSGTSSSRHCPNPSSLRMSGASSAWSFPASAATPAHHQELPLQRERRHLQSSSGRIQPSPWSACPALSLLQQPIDR